MKVLLPTLICLIPLIAQADTNIGIVGVYSESIYTKIDSEPKLLPNFSVKGKHFYLQVPEVGYRFIPDNPMQDFNIGLAYEGKPFDPDESDDANITLLDDRDDSVLAFAQYRVGPITAKFSQDVSDTHNGYSTSLSAGYPIPLGAWRLIPSITYQYMDSNMSNHKFGVSEKESSNTGGAIAAYDSGSVSLVKYSIRGIYPITPTAKAMLGIIHTQYDDKILDSPVVSDDSSTGFIAGVILSF